VTGLGQASHLFNALIEVTMAKKVSNDLVAVEKTKAMVMKDALQMYIGQPLAILCARFNYRGILSVVGEDFVVLAKARAVESSGASSQERPSNEDSIGSSVIISLNACELIYQPNWAFHTLDD
jgi:hypothetical protein